MHLCFRTVQGKEGQFTGSVVDLHFHILILHYETDAADSYPWRKCVGRTPILGLVVDVCTLCMYGTM